MDLKGLKIDAKLEVEVKEGTYQGSYDSKVAEINKDSIKILTPFYKGDLLPLRVNANLLLFYTDDRAAFKLPVKVKERVGGHLPELIVEPTGELVRIQRRNFFRLEVQEDIKYRQLDADLEPIDDFKETVTSDISAGGVKIIVEEKLKKETLLELYIAIGDLAEIPIFGRVVKDYSMANDTKAVGIKFVNLDRQIKEDIVQWLFATQRRLRQKGLL